MGYNSSELNQFQPGDIVIFRSTVEHNSVVCEQIASLQSSLKNIDRGHKTSIHMMIVTAVDKNNVPTVAEMHPPTEEELKHPSYKGRNVEAIPKISKIDDSVDSNLLIIRNKDPKIQKAIAKSATEAVTELQNKGVFWSRIGGATTYLKSLLTSSKVAGANEYGQKKMICSQFVADVYSRAARKLGMSKSELMNVDTNKAMPKNIEHTMKTEHFEEYEFLVKPMKSKTPFSKKVMDMVAKKNPEKGGILKTLYDELQAESATFDSDFDSARTLLFFAKETLPHDQWNTMYKEIKKDYGVFDEDISNIKLTGEAKLSINDAIENFSSEAKNDANFANALNKWHGKQSAINEHSKIHSVSISKPLKKKLDALNKSLMALDMLSDQKHRGKSSHRTDAKLSALDTFINKSEIIKEMMLNPSQDNQQQIISEIKDLEKTIEALPPKGQTKKMLSSAVEQLKSFHNELLTPKHMDEDKENSQTNKVDFKAKPPSISFSSH